MNTTVGVKLDSETRERLRQVSEARERTPHWIIKTALQEFLRREELAVREQQEDEARWQRYLAAGQAIEHERVMAWLERLAEGQEAECPR